MSAGVFTSHAPYRQALGGLASSVARATSPQGSVAALPGGAGWPGLVEEAARNGAVSAVVDDPVEVTDRDVAAVRSCALPVVLDRPGLRPDLVHAALEARVGAPVHAIVVECGGSPADAAGLLRDSLGWARMLAGGGLRLRTASAAPGGIVALLDGPELLSVTVLFTTSGAPAGAGSLRVSALGETRTELVVDPVAGVADLDTVTAAGRFRAAPYHESAHRLALRRALQAAQPTQAAQPPKAAQPAHASPPNHPLPDLTDFQHDVQLARAIREAAAHNGPSGISRADLDHRRYVVP